MKHVIAAIDFKKWFIAVFLVAAFTYAFAALLFFAAFFYFFLAGYFLK